MGSFVKTADEAAYITGRKIEFFDAETITVYWETKADIIRKLLPLELNPGPIPLVSAHIAYYPRTSFSYPYKEAGLFILAEKNGVLGNYALSILVTDDMAMALGREVFGMPKKMAKINVLVENGEFKGSVTRHGINIFSLRADIGHPMNDENGEKIIDEYVGRGLPMYNIKYSKASDGSGFDLMPSLLRQRIMYDVKSRDTANCDIELRGSHDDPWAQIDPVRILGAIYTRGDKSFIDGKVIGGINPRTFLPYSSIRWD